MRSGYVGSNESPKETNAMNETAMTALAVSATRRARCASMAKSLGAVEYDASGTRAPWRLAATRFRRRPFGVAAVVVLVVFFVVGFRRSEERRAGKECRCRWASDE